MKIHLVNLELFIGDNGKVKYRHKRQSGKYSLKAVCGKNETSYSVEIPEWYEFIAEKSPHLCQHCVQSLAKKKQEINNQQKEG